MTVQPEPTLGDVLRGLWAARIYMLVGVLVAMLGAVVFLTVVTPEYKATMIVAPADGYALGDYASSRPYDQLTTLPFWRPSEPDNVSTDFYRFVYTAKGTSVAEILLKDQGVLAGIRKDSGMGPNADKWTEEKLADYLDSHIKIEPLGATPLRRLSYRHPDVKFAPAMLRKIHLVADQMIRRDRRRQSESRIAYLEGALNKTTNPDHRKIITNLLMQQEQVRMLANLDEPYAAIVVEPAASGPQPDWPNPFVVLPLALLAGLIVGYVFWTARPVRDE